MAVLDALLNRFFFLLTLSMLFLVLLVCGGLVFGVSPAAATILALYDSYGLDTSSYKLREALTYFKASFLQTNLVGLMLLGFSGLLIYGLFLLVQLPQTYLMVMVSAINLFLLCLLLAVYALYLRLQVSFDFSLWTGLKLAVIGTFMSFKVLLKFLIGTGICGFFLVKAGLFGLLLIPVLWLLFVYDVLKLIYDQIQQQVQ